MTTLCGNKHLDHQFTANFAIRIALMIQIDDNCSKPDQEYGHFHPRSIHHVVGFTKMSLNVSMHFEEACLSILIRALYPMQHIA
ncbi:hypothetical protein QUC31_011210 [Theobroma cacao]